MLEVTKNKLFQFQSLLKTSPNLEQITSIKHYLYTPLNLNLIAVLMRIKSRLNNFKKKQVNNKQQGKKRLNLYYNQQGRKSLGLSRKTFVLTGNYSYPLVLNRNASVLITKRHMNVSREVIQKLARSSTQLLLVPQRSYATATVNNAGTCPESLKKNPFVQSKNNKLFRHKECHRQECDIEPNCKDKACKSLCGPLKETKVVGNFTHGNPTIPKTTVISIGTPDISGNNKDQKILMYDDAHVTSPTPQDITGTAEINNRIQKIIDHADKK